jgi:anti-anti-sigma factor
MAEHFVRVTTLDSVQIIDLSLPESLDSKEFDALNEALIQTVEGKIEQRWVLDLSAVLYMGSSVLGLMINFRQHIKSGGGRLALCGMSGPLLQIFHSCCLERLFTIAKNRNDAVKLLGGR